MGRLFAISDIHGCFDTFYSLVVDVLKLRKSDRLILLGDYIDRGEKSREVIDFILDLVDSKFNITPLMGNHENMLLEAWKQNENLPLWLLNSGLTTMQSFRIQDLWDLDPKYLNFFIRLKYYEKAGKYLFVHAGFNDLLHDPFQDIHTMLWECRMTYKNPKLLNSIIIHGHRPKRRDFIDNIILTKSHVIPVDTGCVYDKDDGFGFLSALEVKTMKMYSVENFYT